MTESHRNVLFLCTGNACRSQMAEAIVNHLPNPRWTAYSAGMHPAGFIHPMVLRVLEEIGITHRGSCKGLESVRDNSFDLIITLCDSAAQECPVWLGKGTRIHHGYPDPCAIHGSEAERLDSFRKLRDEMIKELPYLLEKYKTGKLA